MKNLFVIAIIFCSILFTSCTQNNITEIESRSGGLSQAEDNGNEEKPMYMQISQLEAKKIMDSNENYVVLDVREKDEYDEGHIPGAVLIPHTQIEEKAESILINKDDIILVYCRSGRRSKIASESLSKLGYTNVKEFGGINDWEYEIEY